MKDGEFGARWRGLLDGQKYSITRDNPNDYHNLTITSQSLTGGFAGQHGDITQEVAA